MNFVTYERLAKLFQRAFPKIAWQEHAHRRSPILLSKPMDDADADEILQQFRQAVSQNPESFTIEAASTEPRMSCIRVNLSTIDEQFLLGIISRKNRAYTEGATIAMFNQKNIPTDVGRYISGFIDDKSGRNVGMTNHAARRAGTEKELKQETVRPLIKKG